MLKVKDKNNEFLWFNVIDIQLCVYYYQQKKGK